MLWILLSKYCFTNELLKVDTVIELPDPMLLSGSDHRRRTGQAEVGAGSSQVTWVPNQRSIMGPIRRPGIKQIKKLKSFKDAQQVFTWFHCVQACLHVYFSPPLKKGDFEEPPLLIFDFLCVFGLWKQFFSHCGLVNWYLKVAKITPWTLPFCV